MHTSVGIITSHRVHNCGSYLQTLALQYYLEGLGARVSIIDYIYPNLSIVNRYDCSICLRTIVPLLLKDFIRCRWGLLKDDLRMIMWNRMIRRNLNLTFRSFYSLRDLSKFCSNYDIYMVGSDQVWNERFTNNDTVFMLSFVAEGKKCVSFASSVAQMCWTNSFKNNITHYLSRFAYLSCRERVSADRIKELLGKEVTPVLDPVFLLDEQCWLKLLSLNRFKIKGKGYILFYVLNYMRDGATEAYKVLDQTLSHSEWEVLSNSELPGRGTYVAQIDTPSDFCQIILNAEMVITDSFHAAAFSLIFRIPFIRVDEWSSERDLRLEDLCQRVAYKESGKYFLDIKKFEKERQYSVDYLNQVICG